jgi:hypothetical protein
MPFKKYAIGRDSVANDIVIDHPTVSMQHAFLITDDGVNFDLVDISAVHGVYVVKPDGPVRVHREKVGLGDLIVLGGFEARVGDLLAQAGVHPQVFVSYSREDRDRSQIIAHSLSDHGLRVWWDDQLKIARAFDEQLEHQITSASSVIVLWSQHSIKSQWVRAEAGVALERGVLIPVFIDPVEAPLLFRQIQGHFVTDWEADGLREQLAALAEKIGSFLRISTPTKTISKTPPPRWRWPTG